MPIIGHVLRHGPSSATDPALPGWVTPALIADTRATWQPFYPQPLTDDDAIEMLLTVGTLFRVFGGADDDEPEEPAEED